MKPAQRFIIGDIGAFTGDGQVNPVERSLQAGGDAVGDGRQPGRILRLDEVLVSGIAITKMIAERKLDIVIEVDGGVTVDNVSEVDYAGADIVVMGSAFYNSEDYAATVKAVKEKCS